MDLFKLIFEHDLRLDALRQRHTDREQQDVSQSIEEFFKPDPTYSKFYFTGTRLDDEQFGLNTLDHYPEILTCLDKAFAEYRIVTGPGNTPSLEQALDASDTGDVILFSREETSNTDPQKLTLDSDSNVGHLKDPLREALTANELVLYKEQAHHGFDLHLFSKTNIYTSFFYPLQGLVSDTFRFFSINGKRIRSERQFYFETWTLNRPPHGAEEVFKESVL